jgi:hypothetical protein
MVAPVSVEEGLGVAAIVAQDPPLFTQQVLKLIKSCLMLVCPDPRRILPGQGMEHMSDDTIVWQEAAVVIAEAQHCLQLLDISWRLECPDCLCL